MIRYIKLADGLHIINSYGMTKCGRQKNSIYKNQFIDYNEFKFWKDRFCQSCLRVEAYQNKKLKELL